MIKRIIGILAWLGVLALVVYTVIGSGSYTSMLPDIKSIAIEEAKSTQPVNVVTESAEIEATDAADNEAVDNDAEAVAAEQQ